MIENRTQRTSTTIFIRFQMKMQTPVSLFILSGVSGKRKYAFSESDPFYWSKQSISFFAFEPNQMACT